MSIPRKRHRMPLLTALAVLAAAPVWAQPQAVTHAMRFTTPGLGTVDASLIQDAAGLWLVTGDAAPLAVALPSGFDARGFEVGDVRTLGDRWLMAGIDHSGDRPRLAVLDGGFDAKRGSTGLGPTMKAWSVPATTGIEMSGAKLLVDDQGPTTLLWLEGERFDAMAVHAARYVEGAFTDTEIISPVGPGTQIAIAAATLADGSTLVTWAGYDGNDDEIWWSRSTRRGWSAPARLADDDRFPDVTPAIIATEDGALIAWSAYDGRDYRLRAARYRDGVWDAPVTFGGRGASAPTFLEGMAEPTVLYKTAVPRTWTVQTLDPGGLPGKKAEIDRRSNRRPAVRIEGENVTLSWPGQNVRPSAKVAFAGSPDASS